MKRNKLFLALFLATMIALLCASTAQAQQPTPAPQEELRIIPLLGGLQVQPQNPVPPPATAPGGRGGRGGQRGGGPANPDLVNEVRVILAPVDGPANTTVTGRTLLPSPASGAWWTNADVVARLGLTDDQKMRLERTFENNRQALATSKTALEREEAQLGRLLDSETIDRAGITAQITKVVQARADLEKTNALMTLDMREVLTRAQWMQLQVQQSVNTTVGVEGPGGRGGRGQRNGGPGTGAPRGQ
jgi:Spy/CpxP family protein refolding chaperone